MKPDNALAGSPEVAPRGRSPWPERSPIVALLLLLATTLVPSPRAFVVTVPIAVLTVLLLSRCSSTRHELTGLAVLIAGAAVVVGTPITVLVLGGTSIAYAPVGWLLAPMVAMVVSVVFTWRTSRLWPLVLAVGWLHVTAIAVWQPDIDVKVFLTDSVRAFFVQGHNPYGLRFLNPYAPDELADFYAPELVDGRFLDFGFPYLPLTLFLELPGFVLGDVRFSTAAAVLLTAGLAWRLCTERVGRFVVMAFLVSPTTLVVVQRYWTEPLLGLALTVLVWAAVRGRRRWAVAGLVGVLGIKQYVVVLVPLLGMLRAKVGVRVIAWAVGITAAVMVPFVVWDFSAFWTSVVRVQFLQPFRPDSTSLLVDLVGVFGMPPAWVLSWGTLGAALAVSAWVQWRAPSSVTWLTLGAGLSILAMLLVSKQAFVNYYYFAYVALMLGAVVWPAELGTDTPVQPDRRPAGAARET